MQLTVFICNLVFCKVFYLKITLKMVDKFKNMKKTPVNMIKRRRVRMNFSNNFEKKHFLLGALTHFSQPYKP